MKFQIECSCGCDILCIEKIWEEHDDAILYFNMYRSQYPGGLWHRLKHAWKYFLQGEFAYSNMTVDMKDMDRLINFLVEAKNSSVNDK